MKAEKCCCFLDAKWALSCRVTIDIWTSGICDCGFIIGHKNTPLKINGFMQAVFCWLRHFSPEEESLSTDESSTGSPQTAPRGQGASPRVRLHFGKSYECIETENRLNCDPNRREQTRSPIVALCQLIPAGGRCGDSNLAKGVSTTRTTGQTVFSSFQELI